jgi:hypothetical protein
MALSTLLALSAYLIIDGNWYAIDTRQPVSYETDLKALVIEQGSARGCTSASGAATAGAGQVLMVGPGLQEVALAGDIRIFRKHYLGIEVTTATGDVVCGGQVSGEPIFRGNFEPGFDA